MQGDEGAQVGTAALDRENDVMDRALGDIPIVRGNQFPTGAQCFLQGAQPVAFDLLADKGRRCLVGRYPFDLAVGIDPDNGLDFAVFPHIARSANLEGLVGQLFEFLLAPQFGQEVLVGVEAGFDGSLRPVHVALQGRAGGIQLAPLEYGGDDEHGYGKNADCEVGSKPEPGLFWRLGRDAWQHGRILRPSGFYGHWYLP
ncbi:hypothetical protein SDC9_164483 [bioreactor metagenome]|uniref:Uncharacterized protein n=1 Tax=bioreactor metagenome TaxID=1076179 RepID=A0A645FYZ6_9ZZZZ